MFGRTKRKILSFLILRFPQELFHPPIDPRLLQEHSNSVYINAREGRFMVVWTATFHAPDNSTPLFLPERSGWFIFSRVFIPRVFKMSTERSAVAAAATIIPPDNGKAKGTLSPTTSCIRQSCSSAYTSFNSFVFRQVINITLSRR